jgi:hypothetical protein
MSIIVGIMCLLFLCSSILILTSFPISQYKKNNSIKQKTKNKDYDILFDVFD